MRENFITVRLNDSEKENLVKQSEGIGMAMSEFCRNKILNSDDKENGKIKEELMQIRELLKSQSESLADLKSSKESSEISKLLFKTLLEIKFATTEIFLFLFQVFRESVPQNYKQPTLGKREMYIEEKLREQKNVFEIDTGPLEEKLIDETEMVLQ